MESLDDGGGCSNEKIKTRHNLMLDCEGQRKQ